MSHDTATSSTRLAIRIYLAVLLVLVVAAALVWAFGWPMLGMIGIVATILVFVIMLGFAAGN